jgi:hypothetical protein
MKTKAILAIILVAGITAMVACGSHATSSDAANASGSTSGGGSQSAAKAGGPVPPAGFGPMRNVEIWDPMFNMVAYTVSIPQYWNFEGTVLHGPGCRSLMGETVFRAYSPDMQYGVQQIPTSEFLWADNETARPKLPGCKILQPMSAEDYGRLILPTIRPGAVVDVSKPADDDAAWKAAFAKNSQTLAQQAAAAGNRNPVKMKSEAWALMLHYDLNGRPEEEGLHVVMTVSDTPTPLVAPFRPGQKVAPTTMELVHVYDSTPAVSAMRAPKGQLMAHMDGFTAIGKSFKANPDYNAKYAAFMKDQSDKFIAGIQEVGRQSIAASWAVENSILKMGEQEQAQRMANSQAFIANMQKQGDARNAAFAQHEADKSAGVQAFNAREDARSGHARDVSDYLLDQQLYVNPTTGQTQTQSNQYDHTYSNGSGPGSVVIQANGPNTNPQGVITGNWTELQPIHH